MHTAKFQAYKGAETLVIFIHGFMGSPDQFDGWTQLVLREGCSALTVLLPGHGRSEKPFLNSTLDEWESHLQKEIDRYKDQYAKIYLVGHSMGGLLALGASLQKENKVCGVLMLSSPVKIHTVNPRTLFAKIKLLAYPGRHEVKQTYIMAQSVKMKYLPQYILIVKPAIQLKKLIHKTKSNFGKVTCPVILVHSKKDETVSFKSAKILYDGLSGTDRKAITLRESWHVHYAAAERKIVEDELLLMIKNENEKGY